MIPITRAAIAIPLVLSLGGVAGTAGTAGTAVYVVDMIFTYGIFFHTNITLEKRGVEGEWKESGSEGCAHSSEAIEDGIIFTFLSLILEKVSEIS